MFAKNLYKFLQLLRKMGFKISYSEMEDFFQSLEHINIGDRNELMWLMQATVVKRAQDVPILTMAFKSFFANIEELDDLSDRWQNFKNIQEESKQKADEDLIFNETPINLSEEDKVFYGNLAKKQQEKIKKFLEESTHGNHMNPEKFRPVIEDLVKSHLKYWRKQTQFNPLEIDFTGEPELDQYLYDTHMQLIEQGYVPGKDLKDLNAQELEEAKRLLKKLAKRFATKISRRYSLSRKAKLIDIRKTIRSSIGFGGVPLYLRYRKRRIQKPSILLIVDVSGSMIRYSTFIIQFMHYLAEVVKKIDTFIFSEKIEKLSVKQIKNSDLTKLEKLIQKSPIWGEGTDIQYALKSIQCDHNHLLTQKTVVIIVSDTKTIKLTDTAAELVNISNKARKVLWLNPMPLKQWDSHASVKLFQQYAQMFPCNTLKHLEKLISTQII
ncbi:VWA domain-containing protein [Desulfitibacter alkalitolerans]|uniref:VWA domain-containing protein n=1 Tax=Desulfitibacter alkalitolerans TaxID=264641 RepID=UPI0004862946|nr:VWA domain-containing protein [Desulfitibacter alkalitolerans]